MKFNWGHGIAVFFIGFACVMASLVAISFTHSNELVAEDYYAQEMDYQSRIDRKKMTRDLEVLPSLQHTAKGILIDFGRSSKPATHASINLYRASDSSLDLAVKWSENAGKNLLIPAAQLKRGNYMLQMEWDTEDGEYYKELKVEWDL